MTFPAVISAFGTVRSTDTTSHSITLPVGVTVGELLLVVFSCDQIPTLTATAGWTKLGPAGTTAGSSTVFWKIATGSDALTITTATAEQSSALAMRIAGGASVTGVASNGNSTNGDPPPHTAPASADILWLATSSTIGITVTSGMPTGFTLVNGISGTGSDNVSTAVAQRAEAGATVNPGPFTHGSRAWICWTLAVAPPAAAGLRLERKTAGSWVPQVLERKVGGVWTPHILENKQAGVWSADTVTPPPTGGHLMDVGINWHADWSVQSDPAVRADILDKMAAMHATSVRIDYAWDQVEPTQGNWRWSELDTYIGEAHARGMTTLLMLYWPPPWAVGSGSGKGAVPRDPAEYGRVLGEIGKRYGAKLAGLEMWNEPDLDAFWDGSQADYLDLIAGAYPVAKGLAPNVPMLAAAPTYLGLHSNWYPNAYSDARFRPGVSFDGVGIHPYMSPSDLPPNAPASDYSLHGIAELQALRASKGDTSPLWATEFGWSTHDNSGYAPPVPAWKKGVTEEQHSAYTLGALIILQQYDVHAAYPYTEWNTGGSDPMEANFGFLRDDRSPKPVVALLTSALADRPNPPDPSEDLQEQIDALAIRVTALEGGTGEASESIESAGELLVQAALALRGQ